MSDQMKPHEYNQEQLDNFQLIKGIGRSIAQILYDQGIHRFSELIELTPEELVAKVKPKIPTVSVDRVLRERWLDQAQALADQGLVESKSVQPVQPDQEKVVEDNGQVWPRPNRENWREIADFFVSFGYRTDPDGKPQLHTYAYHSQAVQSEEWSGIAMDEMIAWILSQAEMQPPEKTVVMRSRESRVTETVKRFDDETGTHLEFTDVWFSPVSSNAMVNGQSWHQAVEVEGFLKLSGHGALELTRERVPYNIDVYLVDTQSNVSKLVSSTPAHLEPGEMEYPLKLAFPTPPEGKYQPFILARLSPPVPLVTHLQGPLLRVEPS